jgi:hypothetical protein
MHEIKLPTTISVSHTRILKNNIKVDNVYFLVLNKIVKIVFMSMSFSSVTTMLLFFLSLVFMLEFSPFLLFHWTFIYDNLIVALARNTFRTFSFFINFSVKVLSKVRK